jgi:hypothetical protein
MAGVAARGGTRSRIRHRLVRRLFTRQRPRAPTYIGVPYSEKDIAKALGARWAGFEVIKRPIGEGQVSLAASLGAVVAQIHGGSAPTC